MRYFYFFILLAAIPLIARSFSVLEVECETDEIFSTICDHKFTTVSCKLADIHVLHNYKKNGTHKFHQQEILITNLDEENYTSIIFENIVSPVFPAEIFQQIPQLGKVMTSFQGHNKIEVIPDFTFSNATNLKTLALHFLELHDITENAFYGATALRLLALVGCELEKIHRNAFKSLKNLRYLTLGHNSLEEIPRELFEPLTELKNLYLNDNQLKSLHELTFIQNTNLNFIEMPNNLLENITLQLPDKIKNLNFEGNRLKNLRLTGNNVKLETLLLERNQIENFQIPSFIELKRLNLKNNKIKSLDFLTSCSHLKSLQIDSNPITDLTNLRNCQKLTELTLESMKGIKITQDTFSSLTNLKFLSLRNTKLNTVDVSWFKSLQNLYGLMLSGMDLKELDYEELAKLPSLRRISITDNNFNCSYTTEMLKFLNTTQIQFYELFGEICREDLPSKRIGMFWKFLMFVGFFTMIAGVLAFVVKKYQLSRFISYRSSTNINN
ncbi:leucine-rich repeat-containing protein 15-like [Culicoides brevitarsis]|uniref:leucine-rich repeat-containing protein 15-like n=1 Tax=Culicoides brevitarsis TaxID=469753 RepID=UPI00307C0D60